MRGHEAQIESTLREAGALPPDEHLVATWSGYLMEFRPSHPAIDAAVRPTAVLGVTTSAIYVLSEDVLLRVAFDRLRGPHSPYRDVLRFSVSDEHTETAVVTMAAKGANAIAHQLNDVMRHPMQSVLRPRQRAKRRPRTEYVN
jgi:hypothetical protein